MKAVHISPNYLTIRVADYDPLIPSYDRQSIPELAVLPVDKLKEIEVRNDGLILKINGGFSIVVLLPRLTYVDHVQSGTYLPFDSWQENDVVDHMYVELKRVLKDYDVKVNKRNINLTWRKAR